MYTSVIHTTDTNSKSDIHICHYCPRFSLAFNADIHAQVTIEGSHNGISWLLWGYEAFDAIMTTNCCSISLTTTNGHA